MTDSTLDFIIMILLINLLLMGGSARNGQKAHVSIDWGKYAPWFGLIFFEVLGGWVLFPNVIMKMDEIAAANPQLASDSGAHFVITTIPIVFVLVLVLMPAAFILRRMEEAKHR